MSRARPPLRIAVDTNVVISSMLRRNTPPFHIIQRWIALQFEICFSKAQIDEIFNVVERPHIQERITISAIEVDSIIRTLSYSPIISVEETAIPAVRDPKDIPILAAAIAGHADYLVTGDNDLLVLRDHPAIGNLRIVTPREFVDVRDDAT